MARDVKVGLAEPQKRLPSKYFYDSRGSLLFEAICRQPEYYLPRTELALLEAAAPEVMAGFDRGSVVELGSGSSLKIRHLLAVLPDGGRHHACVGVDLCEAALARALPALQALHPGLALVGVLADYTEGWEFLAEVSTPRLIAFLGSNIGNFTSVECRTFLDGLRRQMGPGDRLLIGFDLAKEQALLEAAYNDARGVTAAFNRNLLAVLNRELGGNFDLPAFEHVACYNAAEGQIEMHLRATRRMDVDLPGIPMRLTVEAGETLFTETCRKFTRDAVAELAGESGFRLARWWSDPCQWFALGELLPEEPRVDRP
jgi:L-histidine Nalpha-methyltransferase